VSRRSSTRGSTRGACRSPSGITPSTRRKQTSSATSRLISSPRGGPDAGVVLLAARRFDDALREELIQDVHGARSRPRPGGQEDEQEPRGT
jgi:hypothetical protein